MTLEQRPVIHDAVITSLVGSTFLSRGRTYSRKGAVFGVEWNPALLLEIRKGPAMEQPPLLAVQSLPTVAPVAEPAPASSPEKAARKTTRATTPPAPWQEKIRSLLHPEPASRNPGFTGGTGRPTLRLGLQLELGEFLVRIPATAASARCAVPWPAHRRLAH